jgi:AcrR family transcriptional regulator
MSRDELTAEMREDERERQRQRVRDLRARVEPGDGLVRKAMGDALPRIAEPVPELLKLFGDQRDERLVEALGATISIVRRQLRKELAEALAERDPQLRKIAALELEGAELRGAVNVLRGAAPLPAPKFPTVKVWKEDTVYHEGDVVAFAGATYQATKDTARAPGSRDWTCLAAAGGGLTVRGTYDGDVEYRSLDVAMVNGSSFVALRDWPGPCPGDGWHLLASRGSRGSRGERGFAGLTGARGERGLPAPTIQSWVIDRARYTATPMMSDGSIGTTLELRGLFEQFLLETSDA